MSRVRIFVGGERNKTNAEFSALVAATEAQQRRGLLGVKYLPAFTGMLFPLVRNGTPPVMTMAKMQMPLDFIFISPAAHPLHDSPEHGVVSLILTVPGGQDAPVVGPVGAVYVLELAAGSAGRVAGDRVYIERVS
jgi:uncharacterized membrane protein (UPF0127 family)